MSLRQRSRVSGKGAGVAWLFVAWFSVLAACGGSTKASWTERGEAGVSASGGVAAQPAISGRGGVPDGATNARAGAGAGADLPASGEPPSSVAAGGAPEEAEGGNGPASGGSGETERAPAVPSPGCALGQKDVPRLSELPTAKLLVNWSTPQGYDGTTPAPLIFFLHATNQYTDSRKLDADPDIAQHYLVAGPQAAPPAGTFETGNDTLDAAGSVEVILREILATVCVDESRMFAVGNGSGGRELVRWLALRDRAGRTLRLRAVAVIGAYSGQVTWQPLPLLFVHPLVSSNSERVAQDPDGMKAFAALAAANSCGDASQPVPGPVVMACKTREGTSVNPGCSDIQGCAAPVRFCHHDTVDDRSYDTWPCFGAAAISEFFDQYRDL